MVPEGVFRAINYLIEPETEHLEFGKQQSSLEYEKGDFHQALIDRESGKHPMENPSSVDDFLELKNIDRLHMLHADMQNVAMAEARKSFQRNAIDYAFISTHRARKSESDDINSIHKQCLEFFKEFDFQILAETNRNYLLMGRSYRRLQEEGVSNQASVNIAKHPLGSRML